MEDRFSNRQDQALTKGFAVLMRLAWILALAVMVATFGAVAIGIGLVVGILFGSLRLK
jgi:hypothetical protein